MYSVDQRQEQCFEVLNQTNQIWHLYFPNILKVFLETLFYQISIVLPNINCLMHYKDLMKIFGLFASYSFWLLIIDDFYFLYQIIWLFKLESVISTFEQYRSELHQDIWYQASSLTYLAKRLLMTGNSDVHLAMPIKNYGTME